MKTMLRIFLFVALFFAWSGATSAQKLLHSAVYYDTGASFDGSQWMQNTPVGSAYFQIYDNYVYFGETKYVSQGYVNLYGFYGKKYVKEGTGGAQFIVVSNNFDIINFTVELDGEAIGKVTEINNYGSKDICTISTNNGDILLPLIDNLIVSIDEEKLVVIMDKNIFAEVAVYED
jgi:hypothetical protein